jgi:uncharacterized RDD family membrane protein YckC
MYEKNIIIETPEKITFSYNLAEIGTRIVAYMVDYIIQIIISVLVLLLVLLTGFNLVSGFKMESITALSAAFYMLVDFFIKWFYFVFFEVVMNGQSPGKKMARIRVIKSSGESLDFETIILRNFLRVIDGFPVVPLVAGFVAIFDKKSRRIGDIVANTLVVNEIQFKLKIPDFDISFSKDNKYDDMEKIKNKLTEKELFIVRKFLAEKYKLTPEKETEISMKLALQVKKRLQLDETIDNPAHFLERIYKLHGS